MLPSSRIQDSVHEASKVRVLTTMGEEKAEIEGFDYESKLWGAHEVRVSPTYLGAMRLRYCLEDLKGVSGRVLEVGCGGGGMVRGIGWYRPDLELFACDLSKNAVRLAKRSPAEPRIQYGVANGYDLPYENNTFDGFVMFDVLEHVEDPKCVINEAYRVLRPGGLVHIFVPCEGELHTLHGLMSNHGWRAKEVYGGHIQRFRLPELIELLETSGFGSPRFRWSCHIVNQFVDIGYFTFLSFRGRNTSVSIEGYIEAGARGLNKVIMSAAKKAVAVASYFESVLLKKMPGSGAHLVGHKYETLPKDTAWTIT